eukprot:1345356-Amorphochlora_amoeboformis.AAC.2
MGFYRVYGSSRNGTCRAHMCQHPSEMDASDRQNHRSSIRSVPVRTYVGCSWTETNGLEQRNEKGEIDCPDECRKLVVLLSIHVCATRTEAL